LRSADVKVGVGFLDDLHDLFGVIGDADAWRTREPPGSALT